MDENLYCYYKSRMPKSQVLFQWFPPLRQDLSKKCPSFVLIEAVHAHARLCQCPALAMAEVDRRPEVRFLHPKISLPTSIANSFSFHFVTFILQCRLCAPSAGPLLKTRPQSLHGRGCPTFGGSRLTFWMWYFFQDPGFRSRHLAL